jgi:hypothetical protein
MTASRSRQRSMRTGPVHGYIRGTRPGWIALFHDETRNRRHVPRHGAQWRRNLAQAPVRCALATEDVAVLRDGRRDADVSSEVDTSEIHRGAP